MASLAEIRQKYPQYSDMSDQALADALYSKSYSDMPRADFDASIGMVPTPATFAKVAQDDVENLTDFEGLVRSLPRSRTQGPLALTAEAFKAGGVEVGEKGPEGGVAGPQAAQGPEVEILSKSPSLFRGVTDALARGLTGGLTDVVAASGAATGRVLRDVVTGEDGRSWGESYSDRLGEIRQDERAFARANPYVGGTAEMSGMLFNPVLTKAGQYIAGGGTMASRIGRGALTGGPIMGVYGASTAEPGEQIKGGLVGTGIGLGAGALSIPVLEGVIGFTRFGLQKIADKLGGNITRAGQHISEIIKEMGGGDLQAGIAIVKRRLSQFGEESVIADVLGERGVNKASGAALIPGRPRDVADAFVTARQQGRPGRLHAAADEIAPGDFYPQLESITKAQRANAKPLYDEAFAPVSDAKGRVYAQWDDRLEELLQSPDIKKAMAVGIDNERRLALAQGREFSFEEYAVKGFNEAGELIFAGTPNLRSMDAAKRGLDSLINKYRDPTTGKINWDADPALRGLDELRKALIGKLDEITTVNGRSAYALARRAWAGPALEKDAMWQGRRFLRGDEEVSKAAFDKLSPGNQEMFLLGVRREVTKMINTDIQTAVNKFADKKADLWIRFKNLLPEDKFKAFKSSIGREIKKAENEAIINPKYGSPTEKNRQNVADLARVPSIVLDTLESARGGTTGMIGALMRGGINRLRQPSRKVANDMVDMLLEMDPAKQAEIIDSIGRRTIVDNYMKLLSPDSARKMAGVLATRAPSMGQATGRDTTPRPSMQETLGAR
jgi:hypothetical protein